MSVAVSFSRTRENIARQEEDRCTTRQLTHMITAAKTTTDERLWGTVLGTNMERGREFER